MTTLRVAGRAFATTASPPAPDAKAVANPDAAPATGGTIVATPGGVRAAGSFTSTAITASWRSSLGGAV